MKTLSLFFLSLSLLCFFNSIPCCCMDGDEIVPHFLSPRSSRIHEEDLHEKTPLLNNQNSGRELSNINRDLSQNLNYIFSINDLLFNTALVIYPSEYDFERKENTALDVLHSFDDNVFDGGTLPRKAFKCCHPISLELIKGAIGLAGAACISLSMTEYTNGVLEPLLNWTPGGTVSWLAFGASTFLNGPVAIFVFHGIAKSILEKDRSVLEPLKPGEEEGCHYARVFSKSKSHEFLEFLLVPASGMYAAIPTLRWILFNESFPVALLPLPIVLYFAEPYFRIGQEVLRNWYADNFYTTSHCDKETRRAFITSLSDIETALDNDVNGTITNKIWSLLHKRTKNFGNSQDLLQDTEDSRPLFSALSLLLSKAYTIDTNKNTERGNREEYTAFYNRQVITVPIKEKTRREKIAIFASKFLMGASLIPSYFTEQILISKACSQWGAGELTSNATGYSLSALAATRMLLEQEIHRRNFMNFPNPVSEERDHRYIRGIFSVKAGLYALLNSFIFAGITYTALESVPSPMREVMTAVVALRYFSLFFYIGSYEYNKTITKFKTRNQEEPSLEDKKAKIQLCIREVKKTITEELTPETIGELAIGIFNVL